MGAHPEFPGLELRLESAPSRFDPFVGVPMHVSPIPSFGGTTSHRVGYPLWWARGAVGVARRMDPAWWEFNLSA